MCKIVINCFADYHRKLPDVDKEYYHCQFPEGIMGMPGLRRMVARFVELDMTVTISTRYSHILSIVSEMISDGKISCEDVKIVLYQDTEEPSNFSFDSDGIIQGPWTYGILD